MWKDRNLVIDHMRNVDSEMIEQGITTDDIIEVLDEGVQPSKRKKGIIEKWLRIGHHITMAVLQNSLVEFCTIVRTLHVQSP